ncbi:hypothetical protein PMZ80_002421 [Knufia obscura]|uniref:Xylanolytic transcriptional activator regulatory domain-containing protein n=2 Tax=Knufia TaxID=430999 RepID=A0AAN8ED34_9EURO|nr:hypothetical protein PMZ80_002421 [Knufia obscura]KAK5948578.1 hypothetical protein OHC33_010337 [Knufia fluminis]
MPDNDEQNSANSSCSLSHGDQAKLVAAAISQPSSRIAPIFVGEGGYGDIVQAVGHPGHRHFFVPAEADKSLSSEDLAYLKIKGCFTLPTNSEQLVRAYLLFVHPSFPVLDGQNFSQEYASGGIDSINLLLLWSMFSIAASYVPGHARSAVKESYVQRAKLLFDLAYENDKIVLIQSTLLLSFWFAEAEDIKQSWYWTGIAFGIAQTLGIHRDLKSGSKGGATVERGIWRNIWRCCIVRDTWLAFGMGRPLRWSTANSTCPLLPTSLHPFQNVVLDGEELYSASEASGFLEIWQDLVTVTETLREFLTSKETQNASIMARVEALRSPGDDSKMTLLLKIASRHLKLHQYAALFALSQRYADVGKSAAVAGTTSIVTAFLADSTTEYVAPTAIPLIVPAMLSHVKASVVSSPKQSKHDLDTHFRFLSMIEHNYPAASIVRRVFLAVQSVTATDYNIAAQAEDLVPPGFDWLPELGQQKIGVV